MGGLEVLQLTEQRVVVGVGYLGRVELVVQAVVVGDELAKLADAGYGVRGVAIRGGHRRDTTRRT